MKICLSGYGTMGKVLHDEIGPNDTLAGIIDENYEHHFENIDMDVIIDFSHHSCIRKIYDFVKKTHTPVVIATTGYTDEELKLIDDLKNYAPVLFSSNYSLGVILMNKIVREISPILKDMYDIEVVEKHHNKKIDAPSGTAKMLVNSINGDNPLDVVHGRSGIQKRTPNKEIGVHAVRGGTTVGEHEVLYFGNDEVISIKHEAFSKKIFASGALVGAKWLLDKPYGLYNMEDVLFKNNA